MKKLAIIGCGGIGSYHLGHFLEFHDIELAGFCDLIPERAEAFVQKAGCGRAFTRFQEMYDAVEPDMVFICVPPTCHGEIERETIRRGIPFFVEKPVSLDLDLAREIVALIEQKDLTTAVGFQCRYDDINLPAQDFIARNPILAVDASRIGGIPDAPWWKDKTLSGGQLVEQTVHQMDILRYFLGEPDTVYSIARRGYITDAECPGYKTDDLSMTVVQFQNGTVAHMFTGCYAVGGAAWDSKMTFGSRTGRFDYRLCDSTTVFAEPDAPSDTAAGGVIAGDGTRFGAASADGETYKSGVDFGVLCDRTFIDAVLTGDKSKIRSPYADAVKTLAFVLACNESMETGLPVRV